MPQSNENKWVRTFRVYALVDPVSRVVRYVGKTTGPLEYRYAAHCRGTDATTRDWVRALLAPPELVLLESGPDVMVPRKGAHGTMWASSFAEVKWIKRFRRTVVNKNVRKAYAKTWDWLRNPNERNADGSVT